MGVGVEVGDRTQWIYLATAMPMKKKLKVLRSLKLTFTRYQPHVLLVLYLLPFPCAFALYLYLVLLPCTLYQQAV